MERRHTLPWDSGLVLARDMSAVGLDERLRSASAHGSLARIRRGAYVDAATAEASKEIDRYRLTVLAVLATRADAVASGLSAAVLHDLPMTGRWPREVQILAPGASGRRRNAVIETPRRNGEETVESGGLRFTSLMDTLIEVCRTAPFLTALTMVDAACRIDRYGQSGPLITLDAMRDIVEVRVPFRGYRRVQRVVAFAATGADTPFETLSRVVIHELGFPEPILQHPIFLPRSHKTVFCDFGWPNHRVDGEADGWGKYLNPEYGPDIGASERVRIEKRREDQIRGQHWDVPRWEWDDAWYSERLRVILIEAGLPIVRRPYSLR